MDMNMLDLGATRNIKLNERLRLTFRGDAFNSLNRTQFSMPNTTPTSTDFGSITSTSQLPRVVEFSTRLQF
jgi:hypothetical protein